uniref:Uncharacterized protein n=1 Tax=Arundo donax TaxID=35708 RepID=A0A0A9BQ11_ARUDO
MRRRWKEIRDTDALLRKIWQPPPPPATPADHHASDSSSTSLSSQQAYADVVASCSLCRDTVNVASGGSLVAGFTCTPVV